MMMRERSFLDDDTCTPLVGVLVREGAVRGGGQGAEGKSQCLTLNFAGNPKLL